jgi:hypothetical protein
MASLAAAPAPARNASDEIVVEGRQARGGAADYVDRLLPDAIGTQLGRFEDPICPKAIGLTDALGKDIADRIRQVARVATIDVAGETCTPNLILIATADRASLIKALRKARPLYVKGIGADELNRLASSARPFASWQVTDRVAADGMPIGEGDNFPRGGSGARDAKGTFISGDFARVRTTVSPSRLRNTTKLRVLASVVLVEIDALANVTTRQLADFALVRAMAPSTAAREEPPTSSILGLFNAGVTPEYGPQSVTWWDLAFLKALVNTRSDAYANIQKSEIRNHMVGEMSKVRAEQR